MTQLKHKLTHTVQQIIAPHGAYCWEIEETNIYIPKKLDLSKERPELT